VVGPGADVLDVDAGGTSRVLQIDPNVTASISGVTLSGGSTGGNGGGLFNAGTATLTGVAVTGNTSSASPPYFWAPMSDPTQADGGGGLYNAPSGRLVLDDCSVTGNSASYFGGGLFNMGQATIIRSTFRAQSAVAAAGGLAEGIRGGPAELVVRQSVFDDNLGENGSIGGLLSEVTATIDRSEFARNTGGGLAVDGTTKLTSCTIAGNSGGKGGGLLNQPRTATLAGGPIRDNHAPQRGGGDAQ